jgi:hypothetical protein
MAIQIITHPQETLSQKDGAQAYVLAVSYSAGEFIAHGTAIVYGGAAVCGYASAGCYKALTSGSGVLGLLCRDGDCTNEVTVAKEALDATQRGIDQVQKVIDSFGDQVIAKGMKIKVPGVGSTDVDVVLTGSRFIEVGGPAKAYKMSEFGTQLKVLSEYAKLQQGQAYFYYAEGTPQAAIDLAMKWFGKDNVIPIP